MENPCLTLRWAGQYYDEGNLKPGYLVVAYNDQYEETYVRSHASKRHGNDDRICTLQNKVLARILEVDDRVKAYPRPGRTTAVMKIRTIGEYYPIEGWVTIDYFHIIAHGDLPLYAPEGADDLFWSNVLLNLKNPCSEIQSLEIEEIGGPVHIAIPLPEGPPPREVFERWLESRCGDSASQNATWQNRSWEDNWHSSASSSRATGWNWNNWNSWGSWNSWNSGWDDRDSGTNQWSRGDARRYDYYQ